MFVSVYKHIRVHLGDLRGQKKRVIDPRASHSQLWATQEDFGNQTVVL